ncbi:membrane protein insertion efficiency factor YidD [Enterococcus rivorum]|uniref:Putative membrane protein insertion efficiency factor n=1 Tax=Enterococcus rivorum TaxID=762845 RepID=A0A1E5KU54_9ENTE|nr:membrane protein insertion efficiency factor YidD [Enterococcus rivorum]MBP2100705.1 putative membrane protein insertion efficiency factor [Enterococcus rivorum]OEH81288.1 membrane protein insertion efficiency factor YidD [Enterococcus rivorum]
MAKNLFVGTVRVYQRYISPALGPRCRYEPTCSQYMIDAIQTHGSIKGLTMGTARVLRCHPFVKGGIDYVPLKFSLRRNPDEEYHGPYNYRRDKKKTTDLK